MSQRSSRRKNSQSPNKSQVAQNSSQSNETDTVNKCVRYFLLHMGTHVPIKKAQIVENVFDKKPGRAFDTVIQKASEIMNRVYGLDIDVVDSDNANKKYVVTSILKYPELLDNRKDEDMKSTIKFLVLSHIFMSKNLATESSIFNFLKHFKISEATEIEGVGNVHSFVTKTMFKQQYISYDPNSHHAEDNLMKKKVCWGSHAEESVSKMEILNFVSKMYDKQPNTWPAQYESAMEQSAAANEW